MKQTQSETDSRHKVGQTASLDQAISQEEVFSKAEALDINDRVLEHPDMAQPCHCWLLFYLSSLIKLLVTQSQVSH